ncbi:MAG: NrdH-redoxin [Acidimicrobiia bacterium]|nr:NrdH-redoxin [Acidimicrobiia bacterium]
MEKQDPILFYGTAWCGDCRRSKALLEKHGVDYAYVDLEEHPALVEEVVRRNNGLRSIPTIVFPDGSHLTEPSDLDLSAKLGLSP